MNRCHHPIGLLVTLLLPALFAAPAHAAEQPGQTPDPVAFEARLASLTEVAGWEGVPGPQPGQTIWIAPEPSLTNGDVARAWPEEMGGEVCVGLLLTEEGALKLARLTTDHVGQPMALIVDGRVTAAPRIAAPITGGRAILQGNFTAEEARAIAGGIVGG